MSTCFFVAYGQFDNGALHQVTHNFHLKIRNILELTTCPVKFGTTCPNVIFLLATGSRPPCLRYLCSCLAHVFGKKTPTKIIQQFIALKKALNVYHVKTERVKFYLAWKIM